MLILRNSVPGLKFFHFPTIFQQSVKYQIFHTRSGNWNECFLYSRYRLIVFPWSKAISSIGGSLSKGIHWMADDSWSGFPINLIGFIRNSNATFCRSSFGRFGLVLMRNSEITSPCQPVSSRSSQRTPLAAVSSRSRKPPGKAHFPVSSNFPVLFSKMIWPSRSTIAWRTTCRNEAFPPFSKMQVIILPFPS